MEVETTLSAGVGLEKATAADTENDVVESVAVSPVPNPVPTNGVHTNDVPINDVDMNSPSNVSKEEDMYVYCVSFAETATGERGLWEDSILEAEAAIAIESNHRNPATGSSTTNASMETLLAMGPPASPSSSRRRKPPAAGSRPVTSSRSTNAPRTAPRRKPAPISATKPKKVRVPISAPPKAYFEMMKRKQQAAAASRKPSPPTATTPMPNTSSSTGQSSAAAAAVTPTRLLNFDG